jgi:hypothetical protein
MSNQAAAILSHLQTVEQERASRREVPGLIEKIIALKAYQQRRFEHTYADLLQSPRYGQVSRFFLAELYGPSDFTKRDAQFMRVVPSLSRLFPNEIVETVAALAELHALSEALDTQMGTRLRTADVDKFNYIDAWIETGRRVERFAQITLTLDVAARLNRVTGSLLLRNSLRLMRAPARAAGLNELQVFLETGFDTFRAMNGAAEFIETVDARERSLASALFDAKPTITATDSSPAFALALAALP